MDWRNGGLGAGCCRFWEKSAVGAGMKMVVLHSEEGTTGLQHTGSPLIVKADGRNADLCEGVAACKELRRCHFFEKQQRYHPFL